MEKVNDPQPLYKKAVALFFEMSERGSMIRGLTAIATGVALYLALAPVAGYFKDKVDQIHGRGIYERTTETENPSSIDDTVNQIR